MAEGTGRVDSPDDMIRELNEHDYLADDGLATVAYLAYRMRRPLFLEGDPGVGKTDFARALAEITRTPLVRLQCYEGIDRRQALYDWNFPRQMLHLRAGGDLLDEEERRRHERSLFEREYLITRPVVAALERPTTLLVDEVDRADDEFEAFLLEVLTDFEVSIPDLESGVISAAPGEEPWVVITSNRTREVHDALKRRCFYHWVAHPDTERAVAIIRRRVPDAADELVRQAALLTERLRSAQLQKPPGIAETIDWVRALHLLGRTSPDAATMRATLGVLLKYEDDIQVAADTVLGA